MRSRACHPGEGRHPKPCRTHRREDWAPALAGVSDDCRFAQEVQPSGIRHPYCWLGSDPERVRCTERACCGCRRDRFNVVVPDAVWNACIALAYGSACDAVPPGIDSIEAGDHWVIANTSALCRVQSVVVPKEYNVLINPKHPDAQRNRLYTGATGGLRCAFWSWERCRKRRP